MFSTQPIRSPLVALLLSIMLTHSASAQSIRPSTDRLDAIVSYPLVLAIIVDDEHDLLSGVTTKLDDGRVFNSQAFWVGISPLKNTPGWTHARGLWTATPYKIISKIPRNRRPLGTWFIRVPIPIDAVGQGLWIESTRYELNWLPDPERATLEATNRTGEQSLSAFWGRHLSLEELNDPAGRAAIEQYHQDPFENWRARLLVGGLDPDHTRARETDPGSEQDLESLNFELSETTAGGTLLSELAKQYEARWQIILGRIWLIDPDAANRLKSQLMRTARFGDRILPVWSADAADLSRLAHDLLSPFVDDQIRVLRANAWLETQPRALAWVTDDQGQIEENSGRFIATISALSLPQTPGTSLFRVDSLQALGSSPPELTTLPSSIAKPMTLAIDPVEIDPLTPVLETKRVRVRTGRWSATREVIASRTPARAPYVRIGPMVNDWTMNALINNRENEDATTSISSSGLGLLYRSATPTRDRPTSGWRLYLELSSPNPQSPNESVTIWIGPYTRPFAVWRISPRDGGQIESVGGSIRSIATPTFETRVLSDRWVLMLELPKSAFDEDQLLQLGLERTDADNAHTAWPRRMIPDQPEPGRLAIEGNHFDQLVTH